MTRAAPNNQRKGLNRTQLLLLYLVLTAAIATGLAIFSSASTIIDLIRAATSGLFLPLLLSLIVSFLLAPVVDFVERGEIRRSTSILLVFLLLAAALFLAGSWLAPQWQGMWAALKHDLPRYTAGFIDFLKNLQLTLKNHLPFVENYDFAARARTGAEQFVAYLLVQTPKSALRLGGLLVLVPLFSFFFLRDGRRILRTCIAFTPNRYFEMVHDLAYSVSRQMAHFIRGRLLEAMVVGLVVALGLSFTDIRYPPILGLFAGVMNLIPYVGPLIGMVPGFIIAFVDLGIGPQFWWIVTVYVLIAQVIVDNFILIPILISRYSNLHPLWVLLAIIMGGKLYGVLGMILGVPVASILRIALIEIRLYRNAFSLPEEPLELPPRE